jgi:uncharacterized protein YgiM (DUF1202 family)
MRGRAKHLSAFLFGAMVGILGFANAALASGPNSAIASDPHSHDGLGEFRLRQSTALHERPDAASPVLHRLAPNTIVHVVGRTGHWYQIRSSKPGRPDGYIPRSAATPLPSATHHASVFRRGLFRVTHSTVVHAEPSARSRTVARLRPGTEIQVVAARGSWYRIESASGHRPPGYVTAAAAERVRDI